VNATQKSAASSSLSDRDKQYVAAVTSQLQEGAASTYEELSRLTTSGQYAIDDATRATRINQLQTALVDRYAFARHFDSEVQVMLAQRIRASEEIPSILHMYNLQ